MIKFAHPIFLWFLITAPIGLMFIIITERIRRRERKAFIASHLLPRMVPDITDGKALLKKLLLLTGLIFLIIAAADPQIGTKLEEVKREGVDIMAAVDVSNSMMAEDVRPSRLVKAKHELSSFIDRLKGDRIGLIAFAGAAFVQCPLTLDYSAAQLFADVMDTSLIPVQGTAIAEAVNLAVRSYVGKEESRKVLVLITDGEDHEEKVKEAVDEAVKAGITIYTLGMGSPAGAPIPGRSGYLQDKSGSVVLSRLNESLLSDIALQSGGAYYRATTGEDELDKIYGKIFGMEKTELGSQKVTDYEDRFQYFAAVGFLLILSEIMISERRGFWAKFFKLD
ncbi:VWA domain-containing protein [bacterium]|nr:VWA domain-containing protein [FCB group bacterium]MBL7191844.1 VWA domain-containing protein [bacterium]